MPLQIIRQDITKMKVDAIVNTTNEEMVGYSGVDYAVHKGAGPELDVECAEIAPLGLGTAKITKGYNLDAKYIIHTSGPIWRGGLMGESIILKSCYLESLKLAVEYKCRSIAFPLISSGAYGYPKDQVLRFATQIITEFLYDHELSVYVCVYDRNSYELNKQIFEDLIAVVNEEYICGCEETVLRDKSKILEKAYMQECVMCDMDDSIGDCAPFVERKNTPRNSVGSKTLEDYLKDMDKPFAYKLFELIDERGMTDVECYKKANVDKKTFSKIRCNPDTYRPKKQTAVAFAIALKLDFEETQDLLASAGLTLSRSFRFDRIIRYFIQKEIYDIFLINEALFEFDQVRLGC